LKSAVLDSSAVVAFLFKEKGYETIVNLFEKAIDANKNLLITAANWPEIRYMTYMIVGDSGWQGVKAKLLGLPVEIIPIDFQTAEVAADLLYEHHLALSSCFTAALAMQKKLEVYTADTKFKTLEGKIKIVWL
jgi:PIN domain nuclease of toxin-antitoxin system